MSFVLRRKKRIDSPGLILTPAKGAEFLVPLRSLQLYPARSTECVPKLVNSQKSDPFHTHWSARLVVVKAEVSTSVMANCALPAEAQASPEAISASQRSVRHRLSAGSRLFITGVVPVQAPTLRVGSCPHSFLKQFRSNVTGSRATISIFCRSGVRRGTGSAPEPSPRAQTGSASRPQVLPGW